jgi:hypothetical protein
MKNKIPNINDPMIETDNQLIVLTRDEKQEIQNLKMA